MAYTSNPHMAKVRRQAVQDVRVRGLSFAQAGRKYGVTRSAVYKWCQKASYDHREFVPTLSSRPHSHPQQLEPEIVERILDLRHQYQRCAPVIKAYLAQEGIKVSEATIGRILANYGLTKSKRKAKWGSRIPKPLIEKPGSLVQIDTMHVVKPDYSRFYIYAVIDVFSRLGYAEFQPNYLQHVSFQVIESASNYFGFPFTMVQSDNGHEFGNSFSRLLHQSGVELRHSRVKRPNDNAHVERFIRTLQDECFKGRQPDETRANKQLQAYLAYYNNERLHLSLDLMTPRQFVSKLEN